MMRRRSALRLVPRLDDLGVERRRHRSRFATTHTLRDARDVAIRKGDVVRILGVPDLRDMFAEGRKETLPVFQLLVGKHLRVHAIDHEHALLELFFRVAWGPYAAMHFVLLEPQLVVARSRKPILRG